MQINSNNNVVIQTAFAIDRNKDREIQKEERLKHFGDLQERDLNHDNILKGSELKDVYFDYGEDRFVECGHPVQLEIGSMTHTVYMKSLMINPPKLDLEVSVGF